MEQGRSQNQPQRPQHPLPCPRCNSMNTKFRYFNNHNISQPRHYCRDCKRLWTVGGSLRNIPVGGSTRNKQTRVSYRCGDSSSHPPQPELSTFHQNLDAMGKQILTNSQEPIAPLNSYYFDNEFANLGATDSLIQPGVINQAVNVENQIGFGSANVNLLPEWNDLCFGPEQALSQQFQGYNGQSNVVEPGLLDFNQFYDEAGSSYQLPNYDLAQPTWPEDFKPQEDMNRFDFSKGDPCLLDNFSANAANMDLPSTSVDPNIWPQFYGPP